MSAEDLALRMRLTKARVLAIERSEATGTLKLDTLQRAADALDCSLVYLLIPNRPLETMVKEQAMRVAGEHISAVEHTMQLEDQGVGEETSRQQLQELADDLSRRSPRSLWKRRPAP